MDWRGSSRNRSWPDLPLGIMKMTGNLRTPATGQRFEQVNYRERSSGNFAVVSTLWTLKLFSLHVGTSWQKFCHLSLWTARSRCSRASPITILHTDWHTHMRTLTQLLTPALTDMHVLHHIVARTNTTHHAQVSGVSKVENGSQYAGWRWFWQRMASCGCQPFVHSVIVMRCRYAPSALIVVMCPSSHTLFISQRILCLYAAVWVCFGGQKKGGESLQVLASCNPALRDQIPNIPTGFLTWCWDGGTRPSSPSQGPLHVLTVDITGTQNN